MDIGLGDDDGIAVTREITSRFPETRVLILTGQNPSPSLVQAAAEARASGFLSKLVSLGAVVDALPLLSTRVLRHRPRPDRRAVRAAAGAIGRFRARGGRADQSGAHILEQLVDGVDVQAAALRLGITVNTARGYVKNLYRKLGVHNQLELLAVARRRELL